MTSITNDGGAEDMDSGRAGLLSGGFDEDQKRVRGPSIKQQLFKLVNLLTFHNVISSNMFVILLLIEFVQFLGFVFYKINVATSTESVFALPAGATPSTNSMSLTYINYFNMKQILMDIRNSVTTPEQG